MVVAHVRDWLVVGIFLPDVPGELADFPRQVRGLRFLLRHHHGGPPGAMERGLLEG
jgi:hypothetical protein